MADPCGKYEVIREGEDTIVRIDCESCSFIPSIEDSSQAMSMVMDILVEVGNATKIVLVQKCDYEYDFTQTLLLLELARIYKQIVKGKATYGFIATPGCQRFIESRYAEIQNVLYRTLKSDPLGAYVELHRVHRRETTLLQSDAIPPEGQQCLRRYYQLLNDVLHMLESTKLLVQVKEGLAGFTPGDRELYRKVFVPLIKPDFMFAKLMASVPPEGTELASYDVFGTEVTVFSLPDTVQFLYHVVPPEFRLTEEKYEVLDAARKILAEYKPKKGEFTDPSRTREVFFSVGADLIDELSSYRGLRLREKERDELTEILVRYTVGFGLIEVLLDDERVQDITINSPMGRTPVFIVHQEFGDCMTNITPTIPESESWASKLRLVSGRPLDEANPILDTELVLPRSRARVAAITSPLNPSGLAYALRRHRDKPWTLPLFINTNMLSPLAAGTLSFLIDGARTMLVAGTRSAGKTSLLGSMMTELMRRIRIITIEDTLELPLDGLRNLGYNIQSMKVASALTKGTNEVSADEGIRTTLRMGDSSLIVGEVRSVEARALYESMRVGALANLVAGTIHGDSPYGVFDRVVNDLGVPRTSFKATDIIVVANPVRSPDGLHKFRRVTSITEVRKHWEDDPLVEGGFVDLFTYDAKSDSLQPTNDLLTGESEIIKSVAGSVKEWAGNWDAVWDNVQLRARMKQTLVETAKKNESPAMLEASFTVLANDEFHKISEAVREEVGALDSERIFFQWHEWMKRAAKVR